mgnify:CR=1 FL=1
MKKSVKILGVLLLLMHHSMVFAQSMGFNYQAIISMPNQAEAPGSDVYFLSEKHIKLRFEIYNSSGTKEYEQDDTVTTSKYGEVNLIIGLLDPDAFSAIVWDGNPKTLKVEIDYQSGAGYEDSNTYKLLYMPHPVPPQEALVISNNASMIEAIRLGSGLDVNANYHPNPEAYFINQAVSLASADDIMDANI